jgi:hypothetical protein
MSLIKTGAWKAWAQSPASLLHLHLKNKTFFFYLKSKEWQTIPAKTNGWMDEQNLLYPTVYKIYIYNWD